MHKQQQEYHKIPTTTNAHPLTSDLSEHCYTCGDVGRPPPLLIKQFPQVCRTYAVGCTHTVGCIMHVMQYKQSQQKSQSDTN